MSYLKYLFKKELKTSAYETENQNKTEADDGYSSVISSSETLSELTKTLGRASVSSLGFQNPESFTLLIAPTLKRAEELVRIENY